MYPKGPGRQLHLSARKRSHRSSATSMVGTLFCCDCKPVRSPRSAVALSPTLYPRCCGRGLSPDVFPGLRHHACIPAGRPIGDIAVRYLHPTATASSPIASIVAAHPWIKRCAGSGRAAVHPDHPDGDQDWPSLAILILLGITIGRKTPRPSAAQTGAANFLWARPGRPLRCRSLTGRRPRPWSGRCSSMDALE